VTRHLLRFGRPLRALHLVLMISFLGLAATGLPLLFSDAPWARVMARLFGGFRAAGFVHRLLGATLLVVFVWHVAHVLWRTVIRRERGLWWGPDSMVPQPRDVREFYQHVRYFVGLGPRPRFDRFTYWEKFDYWAVLWGTVLMGAAGLVLWFPQSFSKLLPGWMFNVALLVHGAEATLAIGFIFVIHFFNGHLRPEKFPMDLVIFVGSVREDELREERPAQFERLQESRRLLALEVPPPTRDAIRTARIVGALGLSIGLLLFAMIVYAVMA
jgi:cytochrome b subunit of formate dehydrogenase